MPDRDIDVLNKVLEESNDTKYIVETRHGTIEFEVRRANRSRRFGFIDSLPDELVEHMESQEEDQREQMDVDQFSDLDNLAEAEPDESPSTAIFTKSAVEEMAEFIVEHLVHDDITDHELHDFMERWPDEQFFATSFLILAHSSEADGVKDFRVER